MTEENKIFDFEKKLVENLNRYLNYNNISQEQLAALCKEKGYNISQSTISRLCSKQRRITVYYLYGITQALEIRIDELLNQPKLGMIGPEFWESSYLPAPVAKDPYLEGQEFEAYLGDYYIYYLSTNITNIYEKGKIIKGRLSIEKRKNFPYCYVGIKINSGAGGAEKEVTLKYYQGQMVIMKKKNVACITVMGEGDGEISVIMVRHRNYQSSNTVECRIGAALTVSTGDEKVPCIQRVVISRSALSEKGLEYIKPVFRLGDGRTLLLKKDYEEIIQTLIPDAMRDKINKYFDVQEYVEISGNILNEIHEKLLKEDLDEMFYRFQEEICVKDMLAMSDDRIDGAQDKKLYSILSFLKRQGEKPVDIPG